MKNRKLSRLCLPLIVFAIFGGLFLLLNSFDDGDETSQRYSTNVCSVSKNGTTVFGSRCYQPDSSGPCTKTTDCSAQ